jgi:lysophospholipase L1-like esterase
VWRLRVRLDDFAACGGATTTSLVEGGQLEALDRDTRLVTLSIGGNDIRWGDGVASCLLGTDEQCAATQETIRGLITDELPAKLDSVYSQVRRQAPRALVVVTGYAHLFTPESGAYFNASPLEQEQLNEGADLLNDVLTAAARRHHFVFVDVIDEFTGHGANSADPWILGLADPGRFHPNAAGYAAYTEAVAATLGLRPGHGRLM